VEVRNGEGQGELRPGQLVECKEQGDAVRPAAHTHDDRSRRPSGVIGARKEAVRLDTRAHASDKIGIGAGSHRGHYTAHVAARHLKEWGQGNSLTLPQGPGMLRFAK